MGNRVSLNFSVEGKQGLEQLKKIEKALDGASKGSKEAGKAFTSFGSVLGGVLGANVIIGGFNRLTNAVTSLGSSIVSETIKIEQIENQFVTLTGSVQTASKVIEDLQEFTATTPFQLDSVAKAGQVLLAFGTTTEELLPVLRQVGDVAAGSGKDLQELATIFGQVQAAGRLTGERLNQLAESGVNLGPALAKQLGQTESAVRELVSRGVVNFDTFEAAFRSLTEEGGLFFGATIRQSKTLGGVISTLKDNFALTFQVIGKQFLPIVKAAALAIIDFTQSNRQTILELAKSAAQFVQSGAAFDAFNSFVRGSIDVLDVFATASKLLFNSITIALQGFSGSLNILLLGIAEIGSALSSEGTVAGETFRSLAENAKQSISDSKDSIVTDFGDIKKALTDTGTAESVKQNFQSISDSIQSSVRDSNMAIQESDNDTARNRVEKAKEASEGVLEARRLLEDEIKVLESELREAKINEAIEDELAADETNELRLQKLIEQKNAEEKIRQEAAVSAAKSEDERQKILLKQETENLNKQVAAEKKAKDEIAKIEAQNSKQRIGLAKATGDAILAITGDNAVAGFILNKVFAVGEVFIQDAIARANAVAAATAVAASSGPAAPAVFASTLGAFNAAISTSTGLSLATIAAQTVADAIRLQDGGGVFEGGIPGKDSIPAIVQRGELTAPVKSFDEVVEGVIRQRGFVKQNEQDASRPASVMNFNIEGNIIANDESQVNDLIERIRDQIEFRGASLEPIT